MRTLRYLFLLVPGFCLPFAAPFSSDLYAQVSPVLITSVKFEGNKSIGALQLRGLLRNSLEGSEYAADSLKVDLQRVERAYQDEGFLNVKVGPPDVRIQTFNEEKEAVIRIPVTEGSRYSVGRVAVNDVQVLASSTLMQMCPLQQGQPFSRVKFSQWQAKIEEAFREIGYLRVRCIVREALNEADKTVGCTLECAEGKQYSVRKIAVVADESIDRLQFKRRLLLSEGGIFNPEMLGLSIQFLNQTGFYRPISNSDVKIDIDDAKGIVDLTWYLSAK